jgi:predicted amidohydrolase
MLRNGRYSRRLRRASQPARSLVWLLVIAAVTLWSGLQGSCLAAQKPRPVTLVAVQMQVQLEDYQSVAAFDSAIQRYMKAAMRTRGDGPRLVAFPEDVGLGLVFLDDYDLVKDCSSIFEAASVLMYAYGPELYDIMTTYECSPAHALLLLKGERVRQVYYDTFSKAAREHHVTLVAGSAPLPGPEGTVYSTSMVFGPNGKLIGAQRKVHLIDLEGPIGLDLTPASVDDIHPLATSVGRVGVAICYDMFFSDVVDKLVSEGSQILVMPSFNNHAWDAWQIDDWKRGIWAAVGAHPSVVAGVNPMAVGGLWEIAVEGRSSIVGGSFDPPTDGYLAQADSWTEAEIVSAGVDVRR